MTPLGEFLDPTLLQQLNQLQLAAHNVADGSAGGHRRSMHPGASIEFGQHRGFAHGDDPRRIDWRVFARSGRLFVREDQQEIAARVLLAIDRSGSMNYGRKFGTKLRYSSQIVAALAYLLLFRGEATGLTTFAPSIQDWLSPSHSREQLSLILDALARSPAGLIGSTQPSIGSISERLTRRHLVVIVSDFFLPTAWLNTELARLRHRCHEVLLLRVIDPDESEFPFASSVQFTGMESERPALRNAGLIRQDYLRRFQAHARELRKICDRHRIQLHELSTRTPLLETLFAVLGGRSRAS